MIDKGSVVFLVLSVVGFVAISWFAYPFAALSEEEYAMASQPQPAEALGLVQVGDGFGEVPVLDLMDYYIENPPAKPEPGAQAEPEVRFGGC